MALSEADIKAFQVLANDPEDRKVLIERLERHPETQHHPALAAKKELDSATGPLLAKIEELEKKQRERESTDRYERERASLRQRGWRDERIKELEEWMSKDGTPVFHTYVSAADWYRREHSPSPSSNVPILDLAGTPLNSESDWRKALDSEDPKLNPIHMGRKGRRKLGAKLWAEASKEIADQMNSNPRY